MKRSFTLIEIIVAVVILGILATLGFPTYQNVIEDSRARVCETNLRALKTALDIYAMENDQMPGSLGELPQGYINRAYAQVMQRPDAWKTKLAYLILEWNDRGLAYASDNFLFQLAGRDINLITCPGDTSRPFAVGNTISNPSYGILASLANQTTQVYRSLNGGIEIIGDCDTATFLGIGFLALRHKHHPLWFWITQPFAIYIQKNGEIHAQYSG